MDKSAYYVSIASLILALLVTGCGPKGATGPTPAAAVPREEVKAPRLAWQVEWDRTLVEARKEGRVAIYGPHYASIRQALMEKFKESFPEIELEYTPLPGSQVVPRLRAERGARLSVVDLYVGGPGSAVTGVRDFGLPVEEFLILPEVKEGKSWLGGNLEFADSAGKLVLVFVSTLRPLIAYNTEMVKNPDQFASLRDILNEAWKGKIVFMDPISSPTGPGMSTANFIYNHPDLGPDFFKSLFRLEPVLARDERLMAEWVGRGKYPLLLAPPETEVVNLQKMGLPIGSIGALKEGTWYSGGSGTVVYLSQPPHPNAAKVFLNWLLGKDAQTAWSRATDEVSRRTDVPTDHIPSWKVPKPSVRYWADYKEEVSAKRAETLRFLKEVFGK